MEQLSKHGEVGRAAMKAGMDRKTAGKYIAAGKLPSEMRAPRLWRTRVDPFAQHATLIDEMLRKAPLMEALTLFEVLSERFPQTYEPGQLRTLQRHVRRWRATQGPDKEISFAQLHRPGEAAQTDFTHATELEVTILGVLFTHVLCVFVLPFSNWSWATVCLSESMAAIRKGVQRALFQLGRVPKFHQTDNSTAATHKIPADQIQFIEGCKRPFNDEYIALMNHFGMTPRTTEVAAKEQNGDVEAGNGVLKRRLAQALIVRGSKDFESVEAWQSFVDQTARKANQARGERVAQDIEAMRELSVAKLPEFVEERARVSEWSTLRVKHCAYSVPSRLIGEELVVRVYEDRLEAYFAGQLQLSCERLIGRNQRRIDYRHVIWSLVRKPGAFARYVYREEMFPSGVFRRAFDAIQAVHAGTRGDVEYLRILHLAASTMEADVEAALALLLEASEVPNSARVKALMETRVERRVPDLAPLEVDLRGYDALLTAVGS